MFNWLATEIATIKTSGFHVVDGRASNEPVAAILRSGLSVPPSYKEFVLQFGNARLYRRGSVFAVQVSACPTEVDHENETLLQFGQTDLSPAYFKCALLLDGQETPVFEWRDERGLDQVADDFGSWLCVRCEAARAAFSNAEWRGILAGPAPFTLHELRIVEARRKFQWRVAGIAANGDLRFEVYNGSNMTLPYLSIGVRGRLRPPKSGPLNGGVWLPVSTIHPGESRFIEKDCYKDVVDPLDIEVFAKPDPQPESRDRYWEFRENGAP
jgi:hypothetical protein